MNVLPMPPRGDGPSCASVYPGHRVIAMFPFHDERDKLAKLGLTAEQVAAVTALSREVVERVVWEVVPVLAETLIKEEIKRLTAE